MQFFRYSLCIFRCSSLHEHLEEAQVKAPQQEEQEMLRKKLQDFLQAKLANGQYQQQLQTTVEQLMQDKAPHLEAHSQLNESHTQL